MFHGVVVSTSVEFLDFRNDFDTVCPSSGQSVEPLHRRSFGQRSVTLEGSILDSAELLDLLAGLRFRVSLEKLALNPPQDFVYLGGYYCSSQGENVTTCGLLSGSSGSSESFWSFRLNQMADMINRLDQIVKMEWTMFSSYQCPSYGHANKCSVAIVHFVLFQTTGPLLSMRSLSPRQGWMLMFPLWTMIVELLNKLRHQMDCLISGISPRWPNRPWFLSSSAGVSHRQSSEVTSFRETDQHATQQMVACKHQFVGSTRLQTITESAQNLGHFEHLYSAEPLNCKTVFLLLLISARRR